MKTKISTYHRIVQGVQTVLANNMRIKIGMVNSNIALVSLNIANVTPEYSV